MKLPKKVIICGKTYKVIIDKDARGGWFSGNDQEITVGTKDNSSEVVLDIYLHEVIEAIMSDLLMRYKKPYNNDDNGHFLFVFNHEQFELAIPHIAVALKPIIKDINK